MPMLIFLIITVLFWLAANCSLVFFLQMIQPQGALDTVFGWQRMLTKLYDSPRKGLNLLGKALGDCHTCTGFWWMPGWFAAYYGWCRLVLGYFVTDSVSHPLAKIFVFFVWLSVFWSVGAWLNVLATRLKIKKTK